MHLPARRFQARWLCAFGLVAFAGACGQAGAATSGYELPDVDAAADLKGADLTAEDATADAVGTDAATEITNEVTVEDVAGGTAAPDSGAPESGPLDSPPVLLPIAPLTLAEGASTTLDLNPLISDPEDPNAALKLDWSAQHVALKDPGTHVLYIVAPTNWTGTEAIAVTVHDTAGLTATTTLQVTVTEVTIPQAATPDTCGKVTFSLAAGKGQHTVLLSGTFNSWASDAKSADVLTDPGGTGTWSVVKTLAAGVYEYKFIVDGTWQADPGDPNEVPDGYGGKNSVVEVSPCSP